MQLGIENVVGIMGAKSFSDAHFRVLRQFGTQSIGVVFDNDTAHQKLAAAIARRVEQLGIQTYRIALPSHMDANRFCIEVPKPKEAFMKCLGSATNLTTLH